MPPLSPKTQQMQAGMDAGPDQEAQLFEQGFSDMAYALLTSRMPDVVSDVVTFKVLKVDIDKGSGVGAFVVLRNEQPIYIPAILADNAVKPLEIFYHKKLNTFLPLTKGWLDEIDKNSLSSLGTGVKTPETLYTDVDIRNVVVPPITGRFSYAAWVPKALYDLSRVFTEQTLEKTAADNGLMLLSMLSAAPNSVKTAFAAMLKKSPSLFKTAAMTYTVSSLQAALTFHAPKLAAAQNYGGALWIADKDNTPTDFRRIFGDKAGEAYTGVKVKGYAARDDRKSHTTAMQEQPYAQWTQPNQPGIYTLYNTTGGDAAAFVMPNPVDIFDEGTRYGRRPAVPGKNPIVDNSYYDPDKRSSNKVYPYGRPDESDYVIRRDYGAKPYLAVFGNGDFIMPTQLVGQLSIADSVAGQLHKRMFEAVDGAPRTGKGFFVRQTGSSYQATVPVEIKSISTDSDGVRRIKATGLMGFEERVIATDPKSPYNTIWMPRGADVVYLPTDFIWVPLKERLNEKSWFQSALDLASCTTQALAQNGAKKVVIKDAGARQFSVAGSMGLSRIDALKKLAFEYGLKVDDADAILTKTAAEHATTVWVATGEQLARTQFALNKMAADGDDKDKKKSDDKPKKKAPPSGASGGGADAGPPSGDPGMGDPSMGQEAAMAAMAPPAPPPPAPLDLAAMEMDQAIQHEMQKLIERQQTIQQLLQRSSEIGGGAPPSASVQTQAMGAPPSSMNLATGGPGMPPGMTAIGAPPSPMGMGQDPSQMDAGQDPSMMGMSQPPPGGMPGQPQPPMGGDPSMMGQPPMGGDPSQMGGMGMGQDPSQMGGMDMGQDPSQMGQMGMQQPQPPQAMMPPEGPNANALPQEVNPHFLDQAAQLHSADMFDAAAVATLAQSPALHGVVQQYLPNLEKAIDNLARVRLTLWMQEADLKPQIGEQTFSELDENMTSTFKGLGDLVLRLSRGVQAVKEPHGNAP